MFCKTCGTFLQPKKTLYGKWMACPNGHSQPELNKEKNIITTKQETVREILVSDGVNHLAVHDYPCKKCSYNKAELIEVAPFYTDEDSFIRMKCGKCGSTERLEGKLG